MSAIAPSQRPLAEAVLPRIPFAGKIQTLVYSVGATQVAVGIMSAIYVLVTQARYFGFTLKGYWDHLATRMHLQDIPQVGYWLVAHYDIGRHLYLRDAPESVLAFALVVLVVAPVSPLKDKVPLMDRVLARLRMPTPYQGRLGRHENTSPLQMLLLLPSMLFAALPGEILLSVPLFIAMALATRYGYHSAWFTAESPWVPIAVGIAGGKFAGHKPAVKVGQDVQRYFLARRLDLSYTADRLLERFEAGEATLDDTRDSVTGMRSIRPSVLYPPSYRLRYKALRERHAPGTRASRARAAAIVGFVTLCVILAGYGLYVRKWGVTHGFWMP